MSTRHAVLRINGDLYFVGFIGKPHQVAGALASPDALRAMMFEDGSSALRDTEAMLRAEGIPFEREYIGPVGHV